MTLRIVGGSANPTLAEATARMVGSEPLAGLVERFPDGEVRPIVGPVRGDDVYVVQPTGPPVNENLVELALWLDACRRAGAMRVTAVVPYFGYARQDRRTRSGQAIGLSVAADMLAAAGADRLVVVDPHTSGFEAASPVPVEVLSAAPVLLGALDVEDLGLGVVLAPDLGAVRLAERYAAAMDLPVAVVRKTRVSGTTVLAEDLVGHVEGLRVLMVDDMIATGATVEAAVRLACSRGALPRVTVVATHAVLTAGAAEHLGRLDVTRVLVTDTVPVPAFAAPFLEVCSVAGLLGDAIGRLYRDEPLDDLARFD